MRPEVKRYPDKEGEFSSTFQYTEEEIACGRPEGVRLAGVRRPGALHSS